VDTSRTERPPTLSADSLSQVCAAGFTTRYRRSGAGAPVILLSGSGALGFELVGALAARHRVIVPEVPGVDGRFLAWMRAFLDGLGLRGCTVVAAEPYCLAALELALLDEDRVSRLALLPAGKGEELRLAGELASAARGGTLPVLLVRAEQDGANAVRAIANFVDSESPAPMTP
jgi:pimeloyl-ACP methyl ester carboxylesterase